MTDGKERFYDLTEWAKKKPPSTKCLTCRDELAVELIREYLRMARSGETVRSLTAFHDWMAKERGYELTYSAIRNHVIRCEGCSVE